jgi:hypothetical protein
MAIQLVTDHLFGGDSQNDHEKKITIETSTEGDANQHDKKEDGGPWILWGDVVFPDTLPRD